MRRGLAATLLALLLLCQFPLRASAGADTSNAFRHAFWPLDEPAGATVAGDLTGNGHYGTLSAGVTAGAAGPPTGDGDTAMAFHGADAVTVASLAGLPSGTHPYSLEAWVLPAGTGGNAQGLLGYGNYGVTRQSNALRLDGTGGLYSYWWADDLSAVGAAPLAGAWHQVVASYDGHARRLYLDGVPFAADAPANQPNVALANLALGQTNGTERLTGSLANVAIYPYALTPARVARHYALGEHSPAPTPTTSVLQYSYDGAGRLNSIVYPDGGRENHSDYDPAGRVTHISLPDYTDYYLSYNAAGQRTQIAFPNGGKQHWAYDAAGRPRDSWWAGPGVTVPFTQTATLDRAGQRVVLQDTAGSTTYGYDGAGRLTSASYPDGSTEADQYDQLGDRTTITSTTVLSGTAVTTNSFDAAAQLTTSVVAGGGQQGTTTYAYDGNGNQTGSAGPAGTVANTFNQQDQLTHVSGPATNETFVYDGQGDRLRAYDQSTANYQLHTLVQDLRPGGMSGLLSDGAADYGYADFGIGAAPIARMDAGSSQGAYLASDLLGSVRLATNPSDQTLGSATYDAWGNARPVTADAAGQVLLAGLQASAPFGYAGQAYDAGPGTYSMRARQYDPAQGRFQSMDPQAPSDGYPVTLNPYQYAGDMVTGTTDPSGRDWVAIGAAPDRASNDAIRNTIIASYVGGDRLGLTTSDVTLQPPAGEPSLAGAGHADIVSFSPVPHNGRPYGETYDLVLDASAVTGALHDLSNTAQYAGMGQLSRDALQHGLKLDIAKKCLTYSHVVLEPGRAYPVTIGARDTLKGPGVQATYTQFLVPSAGGDDVYLTYASLRQHGIIGYTVCHWQPGPGIPCQAPARYHQACPDSFSTLACAVDLTLFGGSFSALAQCDDRDAGCQWLAALGIALTAVPVDRLAMGALNSVFVDRALARLGAGALLRRLSARTNLLVTQGGKTILLRDAEREGFLAALRRAILGGCGCFPGDTGVATPHGLQAIASLHVGDAVLAEDPGTGKVEPEPVLAVIDDGIKPTMRVGLSDGSSLQVTTNHPFYVDGGPGIDGPQWVQAGDLRVGDRLRTEDGRDLTVAALTYHIGYAHVYTLTVAKDHTFFVGAARVLVHNADNSICIVEAKLARITASKIRQAAIDAIPKQLIRGFPKEIKVITGRYDVAGGGGGQIIAWPDRGALINPTADAVQGFSRISGQLYGLSKGTTIARGGAELGSLHAEDNFLSAVEELSRAGRIRPGSVVAAGLSDGTFCLTCEGMLAATRGIGKKVVNGITIYIADGSAQ